MSKFDKYWFFGVNSLWCKFWKIFGLGRFCIYKPEEPVPPPGPPPPEPPPPEPPPPPPPAPGKHKLAKAKRYAPGKKALSPCLIPQFGFAKVIKDKDAEDFADRFAFEGWGNFMRLFVAGNWEPEWQDKDMMHMPYMKLSGKFALTRKNPAHFDCLWRRGDYLVDRYIMPMLTLLDNCSLKTRKPGHWRTHWMNGDNNVNGTSNEAYSQTHWYEYDGTHPKHEERPGMKKTGEFLVDLYGYVLEEAKKRWGHFFLVEIGNEIDAKNEYHTIMREFIDYVLKQGDLDGRVFTSMEHDSETDPEENFYSSRTVNKMCIPIIHKIGNFQDYQRRKALVKGMRHGASQDGQPPIKTAKETKENVLAILKSDSVLFEGNLRPIEWPKICGGETWSLKDLKWELFWAYSEAFDEYLSE